jgi:hypothetical protein
MMNAPISDNPGGMPTTPPIDTTDCMTIINTGILMNISENARSRSATWVKKVLHLPLRLKSIKARTMKKQDAAVIRSDAGSIVPRPLPSETMFMLMLVHLKARIDEIEEMISEKATISSSAQ